MLLNPSGGAFLSPLYPLNSSLLSKFSFLVYVLPLFFFFGFHVLPIFPFLFSLFLCCSFFLGFWVFPFSFGPFIINLIIGSPLNPYEVILSSLGSECALHQLGFLIGELLFQSSLSLSPVLQMCPVQTFTNE
jgi:hypothetical protein